MDRLLRRVLALVMPYPGRFRLSLPARPARPAVRAADARCAAAGDARLAPARLPLAQPERQARRCSPAEAAQGPGRADDRLRPAGAGPRHQRRDDPAADPPRRRGGGGRGRGLLRRADPSHGPRGRRACDGAARNIGAWTREIDGRRARRDHHQHLGLRHDGQGLRLHVPRRPAAPTTRPRVSALAKDVTEFIDALGLPDGRHAACGSPITPPVRCSTARRSPTRPRTCCGAPVSRWSSRPTRISAAAPPAPTT